MTGDATTLTAIIITYQRPDELRGALESLCAQQRVPDEIIILDNDPAGSGRPASRVDHAHITYVCPGENLGVTGGRNRAAAQASGDILFFLDDDATLEAPSALDAVVQTFTDSTVACLACLIRNAFTREIDPKEYPGHHRDAWGEPHDVSYFVGAGFAVRRKVFAELGGFDEALFYNGEELELSYRLLKAGWRICYQPEVVVLHRVAAEGRQVTKTSYWLVRNRLYVGTKHLPFPYLLSYLAVWSGFSLYKALRTGDLGGFTRGVRALWADHLLTQAFAYRRQNPMPKEVVRYLKAHDGRLLY